MTAPSALITFLKPQALAPAKVAGLLQGPAWPLCVGLLVAVAFLLRIAFSAQVLLEVSPARMQEIHGDSADYVQLGRNLALLGNCIQDTPAQHHLGLLRTPGYPAIIALCTRTGLGLAGLFALQSGAGASIVLLETLLAARILRSRLLGVACGAAGAFSPTGVGLSAVILSDMAFAAAAGAFIALFILGIRDNRPRRLAAASCFLAFGIAIKPALVYVPLPAVAAAVLLRPSSPRCAHWGAIALVFIPMAVVVACWSWRNRAVEGQFTYCSVDAQNLRQFLAPFTEEMAEHGIYPGYQAVHESHLRARDRDADAILSGRLSPAALASRQRSEALAILARHPIWAVCAWGACLDGCAGGGWWYFDRQLPRGGVWLAAAQAVDVLHRAAAPVAWLLAAFAVLPRLRPGRRRSTAHRPDALLPALAIFTAYFLIIGGTSFMTGARVMYPVEFAVTILAAAGARGMLRRRHRAVAAP